MGSELMVEEYDWELWFGRFEHGKMNQIWSLRQRNAKKMKERKQRRIAFLLLLITA